MKAVLDRGPARTGDRATADVEMDTGKKMEAQSPLYPDSKSDDGRKKKMAKYVCER